MKVFGDAPLTCNAFLNPGGLIQPSTPKLYAILPTMGNEHHV
jgi:hypothetical protein